MNQLKALCRSLSLALAASLLATAVCYAQTPAAGNPQGKTEKAAPAPDKDKPATTTTTAAVEEELAKTPAGKTVARFFAAFNSGDIKQMRAYHESTGGNAENADKDMEVYEQTGGLKLHSLLAPPSKENISLLLQEKKGSRWIAFEFTVGAEEPHQIMSISVRPAQPPAN